MLPGMLQHVYVVLGSKLLGTFIPERPQDGTDKHLCPDSRWTRPFSAARITTQSVETSE